MNAEEILTEEQQLVIAQLNIASASLRLYVLGPDGNEKYTRDELIKHVKDLDDIGREFIRTQMELMRSIKTGEIADILGKL